MKISHYIPFIFCIIFITSCKRKYEDGPLIILSTKCKRLVDKSWQLEYILIDNEDSTEAVYKSIGSIDNTLSIDFLKVYDGRSELSCMNGGKMLTHFKTVTDSYAEYDGYYDWVGGKKYLKMEIINTRGITSATFTPVGPFFAGQSVEYRIKKLTKTNLWLEVTFNDRNVVVHFKR